jgi:16S rRNA (guanine1207-N2)-methyltransferase
VPFPFDALRRWPDVEAPDLPAADAADRLILDESAAARADADDLVVIGDGYGALTLGAVSDAREHGHTLVVRTHQDALTSEQALAANAARLGFEGTFRSLPLTVEVIRDATLVLLRLPRSLDALRDIAGFIALHASPEVVVYAGGRLKHMTVAMNGVLREFFDTLDVTHARQKSRVLVVRGPHGGRDPEPRRETHEGLVVCAFGGTFAGASIDMGTRLLLQSLPEAVPGEVIDLACGTGVVGAWLATRHPELRVYATDQSAVAVASARATAEANGVGDRMIAVQDDALSERPDGSADFIALNPPFHVGGAIHEGVAPRLFADASRVLRPGGELWTVWNSALFYRPTLERLVGPTRQIARNAKFTVTASAKLAP